MKLGESSMRAYEIRQKAREVLKNLPGKYQLFLIPIILSMFATGLTIRESLLTLNNVEVATSATFFPLFINIILILSLASASFTILDVLRHKRQEVRLADSNLIFSEGILGQFILTILLRWFYIFLWSLICMVGLIMAVLGITILIVNAKNGTNTTLPLIITFIGVILYFLGLILVIVKQYAYSIAEYILYDTISDNSYDGPRRVLSSSSKLMKGNKWKLFCLDLSFLGWYILTPFTFGLLYFYVLPYVTTARLIFYNNLVTNDSIEPTSEHDNQPTPDHAVEHDDEAVLEHAIEHVDTTTPDHAIEHNDKL